ncbi:MAG: hypothetical protein M5U34_18640 [Chloroflexi bacterium]|nr:hypothetical protein [Chloroflexota bacterium]
MVGDTAVSDNFMAHPLLPDIRSETAVPLLAGRTVVGALDLQSDQPHTFTEENLPAFVTPGRPISHRCRKLHPVRRTEAGRKPPH